MRHSLGRLEVTEVATGLQGALQLKATQPSLFRTACFFFAAFVIVFECLFIHNQVGLILHFIVSFGCLVPVLLNSS